MKYWNDDTHEEWTPVEAGLEAWARRLDEQRYPGRVWPPAARPCRPTPGSRSVWWIATCIAAAALTFAVTLRAALRPVTPEPLPESAQAPGAASETSLAAGDDLPSPHVFMVEDLESYSIIDVTNEVAVVAFTMKGGSGPEWLVALPPSRSASDR